MLNQEFREFIQSLNNNKVDYLVIDGYAVAFTVTSAIRKTSIFGFALL